MTARTRGRTRAVALVSAVVCAGGLSAVAAPAGAAGTPWVRHTIASGWRGADGVHLGDVNGDGRDDVTSGWEQEGIVTVSLHPGGTGAGPWPTVTVGSRLHGVEDAQFVDVDGDGALDVVSACECRRLTVHFGPTDPGRVLDPSAWESVTLAESVGFQRWIKVAIADVDGDGRADIVGGGKANPATVGWFRAPADPRDGAAWPYAAMSPVAWTMSLVPRDVDGDEDTDVVLSDRLPIIEPDGHRRYELRGSRWLENLGGGAGWVNHPIGFGGGEHKFLHIVDVDGDGGDDVLDGVSGATYNRSYLRRNTDRWLAWEVTEIPQPAGVGQYLDVAADDVDRDGDRDLVFSYSHADGDLSGVALLAAVPGGGWERREVSGPVGTKFDNVVLHDVDLDGDLDAITSEQVEQLGVIWYENPTYSSLRASRARTSSASG